MNKGELAQECALGKAAAEQVLASVFGAITDAMAAGDKVIIPEKVKERRGYRLSLGNIVEITLGLKKSADGLTALK